MAAETFGPYRIGELLGRGGMGEVHRAYDTAHDRVVALKRLSAQYHADDDFRARFRSESKIVARLREPHVIPIHAYGEIEGRLYIDMRLVEGQDLTKLLEHGPLEPRRAVRILEQVASALDAAHEDGLVHRDVKPSNILVGANDFVYLVDFGIARSASPAATHHTASGDIVGTLDYMAPERFGAGPVDGRVDVYALACVLFSSVADRRPFLADSTAAQIWAHMQEPPPRASSSNPNVPPALDDVIAKGMAKDPAWRYPTAGALASAAAAALDAPRPVFTAPPPVPAPPLLPPPRPVVAPGPPWQNRAGVLGAVAAVVVIAAVVVAVALSKGARDRLDSGAQSSTATTSTTAESGTTTTTAPSSSVPVSTTTTPPGPGPEVAALLAVLPSAYKDNPGCAGVDTAAGAVASVACTGANRTSPFFPPPEKAVFHHFADRGAQDAFFLKLVGDNNIPRDDSQGGCRPLVRGAHYSTYYRNQSGPLEGEFTTCFVKDGVGQVWWVDTKTLVVGSLLSTRATGDDDLDKLGYWWNEEVLSPDN
ncbi:serine/threonine-protein kinase [Umezawaea tangerina]|uniref:non-specific serine/threonine protein kinase n=1 Tax=Umezawaea tangerina TaxID=84725 RepID=A0A2T0SYY3_9PSEU|nr:serine/threonine-protein kinase [Umezawaea tangerina]PRY38617.1 serine/threonine-protein kinase [Umezawaea tangerina]